MTARERALEAALAALESDLKLRAKRRDRRTTVEVIELPIPEEPHYVRFGMARLEILADDLTNPRARRKMLEADFAEVARVLRSIAVSKQLRKAVFPPSESSKRGRPRTNAPRDFLIAMDYWIRREV